MNSERRPSITLENRGVGPRLDKPGASTQITEHEGAITRGFILLPLPVLPTPMIMIVACEAEDQEVLSSSANERLGRDTPDLPSSVGRGLGVREREIVAERPQELSTEYVPESGLISEDPFETARSERSGGEGS